MTAELHETEIDGVRCFWVDAHRPTLSAQLTFRQGMADEALYESGWQHLLEHLCLRERGGGALHVNGAVSLLTTEFTAHGPVEQVAQHLSALSGWLADPDLGYLDRERDVLRAEARLREGPALRALVERYGFRGPGVAGANDPGLGRATAEALTARARRVFTQDNAVLALDGPPPAGLRLNLRMGGAIELLDAVPYDNGPAAYIEGGGVIVSGVVDRSESATVAPQILQRALRQNLRDGAGAAYAPWSAYHRVDGSRALVLAGSDVSRQLLPELADLVLDTVSLLTRSPVPQELLDEVKAERLQAVNDPYNVAMLAWRGASQWLLGGAPETLEELIDHVRSVDAEAVRRDLEAIRETLLLGIPSETTWNNQLPMSAYPTSRQGDGRRWRHRDWPANDGRLTVGESGISISAGGQTRSIALNELAGLFSFPDGGRWLAMHAGWGLSVEPDYWQNGHAAVEAVDRAVPPHLHLPQPPRDYVPYRPMPTLLRWGRYAASRPVPRFVMLALGLLAAIAGVSLQAGILGANTIGTVVLVIGVSLLGFGTLSILRRND